MQTDLAKDSPNLDRILAAARWRFENYGFRRTAISGIAREAGVAVGTIYRYFENKEQILVSLVDQSTQRWLAEVKEALRQPGSADERLGRLSRASVGRCLRDRLLNSILEGDAEVILAPLLEQFRQKIRQQNVALIAQVVREGVRSGEFKSVDPEKAAFILWTAGGALSRQKVYPYQEILPLYGEIAIHGLLRKESNRRSKSRP